MTGKQRRMDLEPEREMIRLLLPTGMPTSAIAKQVGCSLQLVAAVRRELNRPKHKMDNRDAPDERYAPAWVRVDLGEANKAHLKALRATGRRF